MKKILILALFLISNLMIWAQAEIWLIDGKTYKSKTGNIDTAGFVEITKENGKINYIDTTDIFAIIKGNDTLILYNDPNYPTQKAKMFVIGEIYGRKYKNPYIYAGAFVTGFLSPIILKVSNLPTFVSPILPAIYVASFSSVNSKNIKDSIPASYIENEDFVKGYKFAASRKKIKNSVIYSVAGLATGIAFLYIIEER
jgi:hypothetical protein